MGNKTEVSQLRERIQREYESAHYAMNAPAITAPHKFITSRMENLQHAHEQLQAIVGEAEGVRMMAETLDCIAEDENTNPFVSLWRITRICIFHCQHYFKHTFKNFIEWGTYRSESL